MKKDNKNIEYKERTEKAIRKDIINTIYTQIDKGYAMEDRVLCFYERGDTTIMPNFIKFYKIVKIGSRYEVINKEESGDFFQITKNGRKIEASGFGLEDIIKIVVDNQDKKYFGYTLTNEEYFEIKLENIKDEFAGKIKGIKSEINLLRECQQNLAGDYRTLSFQIKKIKENQEEKRNANNRISS